MRDERPPAWRSGRPTPRQIALALLLATIGAASWWWRAPPEPSADASIANDRQPDYTVEELLAVTMDAEGLPSRRLRAARLRHYPDDTSELDAPRLWFRPPQAPSWNISAEHGWIGPAGEEVRLHGDVVAIRDGAADMPPVILQTSAIRVLPKTHDAQTDQFVEIVRATDWITAERGLEGQFGATPHLRLFGRVRARIHPAPLAAPDSADDTPGQSPGQQPDQQPTTGH